MLRTSLRSVRGLSSRPFAAASAPARQWHPAVARPAGMVGQRYYADEKRPAAEVSKPPATETSTARSSRPPPGDDEAAVESKTIPPENMPLEPPPPEDLDASSKTTSTPPPPPEIPAPKGRGFFRTLRNYMLTLTILGAVAFGGGVWYSRINDNFHDFFTEYVPYGEQAVLYLEEMEFRRRFPNISNRGAPRPRDTGEAVRIPAQSGMSWRVADSGEPAGRQSSAVDKKTAPTPRSGPAKPKEPASKPPQRQVESPKIEDKPVPPAKPRPVVDIKKDSPPPAPEPATVPAPATPEWKPPEVDEPSRFPPASPIDHLKVNDAEDPVVQKLVHMLNDIITVVNADNASEKYGRTIGKAKEELDRVGGEIKEIKASAEKDAAARVKARVDDFDKAATELVDSVEKAMAAQQAGWQQEFDQEMKRIKEVYDERLKIMTERERMIHKERLGNKLLEQSIQLKREFETEIQNTVEKERGGRLGKLEELSKSVSDLEKLAAGWNDVVDTTLRTQKLHVAVEAVRGSLQDSAHPRPFIKELVALKEIAADDTVVNAAIASINPSAYQRGISTSAELIERFRRVATEVRKASLLPDHAGVASHASSLLLSKVMFKKQGLAAGDDVESILTRTQTLLEEGDLDAAAREMNGLTGWAKTLSRDWLSEMRKVLEVQQALEVIQTEARLQSLRVD